MAASQTLFRADEVLHHLLDVMAEEWPVTVHSAGQPDLHTILDGFDRAGSPVLAPGSGVTASLPKGSSAKIVAKGPTGTVEFFSHITDRDSKGRMTLEKPSMLRVVDPRSRRETLISDAGEAVFDVKGKDGFVRLAVLEITRQGLSLHAPKGVLTLVKGCRLTGKLRLRGRGSCKVHIEIRSAADMGGESIDQRVGARFQGLDARQRHWLDGLAGEKAAA